MALVSRSHGLLALTVVLCLGLSQALPPTPVDPVLPGWSVAGSLCVECGEGTACGVLEAFSQVNFSDGRVATYPQGSALTCYKKDYSADFLATEGGRCVPSKLGDVTVENFCEAVLPPRIPGRHLSATLYQALAEQREVCEPCCDGHFACGGDLICKRLPDSDLPGGVCAYPDRASTCSGHEGKELLEVLCDSCLPDFSTRRQLTGEDKDNYAPLPSKDPGDHCNQLAVAGLFQQLSQFLLSQADKGEGLIGLLPSQIFSLQPFATANYLLGAWLANQEATVGAVVAIWQAEVSISTKIFTELVTSHPRHSAAIYTASAHYHIDLSAVILAGSLLSAHPSPAQIFLVESAKARAFTAGTAWGTSYKQSQTASLDLFAHAASIIKPANAGHLARTAVVAQEYANIAVSAKEFTYMATAAGTSTETLSKFNGVWRGV